MLGDSSVLGSSGGGGNNTTAIRAQEGGGGDDGGGGGVGSNSGEEERSSVRGGGGEEGGDRSFGGNRWPRQETLALLKIRSDMDVAFRDASFKGPLWEEVSRKLAELGYHRSAKKCKEKFENVYKYHRRTKEGRTGKSDGGKTYRFFDQLEALENQPPTPTPMSTSTSTHQQPKAHHQSTVAVAVAAAATTMATMAMTMSKPPPTLLPHSNISTIRTTSTVPSAAAAPHPIVSVPSQGVATPTIPNSFPPTNPTILPPPPQPPPTYHHQHHHATFPTLSADLASNYSTSSSTSSDEELEGRAKRKRKRKWKDFFERLMKEVIQKQEELQQRFLEAIEKREHERMVREEAWRMQEMTRINREREILAQERSITAAKDAAVMSFLQKISEQQQNQNPGSGGQLAQNTNLQLPLQPPPPPPPPPQPQSAPPPPRQSTLSSAAVPPPPANNGENINFMPAASSSRWPKVEVQALIKLRTSLDSKYQENGPKGPLWEEISAAMRNLGYNRNAKRCKEKWENINKYFKKVKESNKRRPEDSKTCPYFHQLDNLYRERNKFENHNSMNSPNQFTMKAENAVPLMVRPEQQWPPQQENNDREDHMESENIRHDHQNQSEDREDNEEDEDEDEEEESGDIGNYEIVPNKGAAPPVGAAAAE